MMLAPHKTVRTICLYPQKCRELRLVLLGFSACSTRSLCHVRPRQRCGVQQLHNVMQHRFR